MDQKPSTAITTYVYEDLPTLWKRGKGKSQPSSPADVEQQVTQENVVGKCVTFVYDITRRYVTEVVLSTGERVAYPHIGGSSIAQETSGNASEVILDMKEDGAS